MKLCGSILDQWSSPDPTDEGLGLLTSWVQPCGAEETAKPTLASHLQKSTDSKCVVLSCNIWANLLWQPVDICEAPAGLHTILFKGSTHCPCLITLHRTYHSPVVYVISGLVWFIASFLPQGQAFSTLYSLLAPNHTWSILKCFIKLSEWMTINTVPFPFGLEWGCMQLNVWDVGKKSSRIINLLPSYPGFVWSQVIWGAVCPICMLKDGFIICYKWYLTTSPSRTWLESFSLLTLCLYPGAAR